MQASIKALSLLSIVGTLAVGCGAADAADTMSEPSAVETAASHSGTHHRRGPAVSRDAAKNVVSAPAPDPSADQASAASPSGDDAVPGDIAALIASAQNPEGLAIPQSAGPNGECPAVVVALGFWACTPLNSRCSFTAGSAVRHCLCNRTDGEGQTPSWVCD